MAVAGSFFFCEGDLKGGPTGGGGGGGGCDSEEPLMPSFTKVRYKYLSVLALAISNQRFYLMVQLATRLDPQTKILFLVPIAKKDKSKTMETNVCCGMSSIVNIE